MSIWAGNRWDVLVDLCTAREGRSDLVMAVSVFERESRYVFQVDIGLRTVIRTGTAGRAHRAPARMHGRHVHRRLSCGRSMIR